MTKVRLLRWIVLVLFLSIDESRAKRIGNRSLNEKCNLKEDVVSCEQSEISVIGKFSASVTRLEFAHGKVPVLRSSIFIHLSNLRYLNLHENEIENVTSSAFDGLFSLNVLDLSNNLISFLPPDVFKSCLQLSSLNLGNNLISHVYSIAIATAQLLNLTDLSLESNHLKNADEWGAMNKSNLSSLNLRDCQLKEMKASALSPLLNLTHLDLSKNKLDDNQLVNALVSKNLTILNLDYMSEFEGKLPRKGLARISETKIRIITFVGNNFSEIKSGDFPEIPSLLKLDLADCNIEIIRANAFDNLCNLQYLKLTGNNLMEIPSAVGRITTLKWLDLSSNVNSRDKRLPFRILDNQLSNLTSLKELHMNNLIVNRLPRYAFNGLVNLRKLCLQNSVSELEDKTFEDLKSLNELRLYKSSLKTLTNNTFFGLNNLRKLNLERNKLNLAPNQNYFRHTPNLEDLDLRGNELIALPIMDMTFLVNLEKLLLDFNFIGPWNESVKTNSNAKLELISLKNNNLHGVTPAMIEYFSLFRAVDVSANPFDCTCELKDFVYWLLQRPSTGLLSGENIKCSKPREFADQFPSLEILVSCIENAETSQRIIIGISLCIVLIVLLTFVFVCYYFRWYFRYFWFLTQAKVRRRKNLSNVNYQYDAFISYNENDRSWLIDHLLPNLEDEEPKLKLCLHERDFELGKEIIHNIVESIDNSRKIILVLSNNFLKSQWCTWELNMAQFKLIEEKREAFVLIMLEGIDKEKMSSTLRYLIRTRTYLEWTNNVQAQKLFWERLRSTISKTEQNVAKLRIM